MKFKIDFMSLMLFAFCLPPGNLLFVFFSSEIAFSLSKILTVFLCGYWLYRLCSIGKIKTPIYALCFIFPMLSYAVIGLYHSDFSSALIGILKFVSLSLSVFFCYKLVKCKPCECDNALYCFCVFSAFCVIISLCVTVIFPNGIWQFENPDGRTSSFYILSTSNAVYNISFFVYPRMAYFFDEPGTYAAFCFLSFIYMKLTGKSVYAQFLVVFSGVLTFSLGFIISLLCFFLLDLTKVKRTVTFTLFILVAFIVSANIPIIHDIVDQMLIGRMTSIFSGGGGDTRSSVTINAINNFIENPFFGAGFNTDKALSFFGANIFFFLAIGGVFFILCYLPLSYIMMIFLYKKHFSISISLLLLYMQRPDFLMPYSVVFSSLCIYLGLFNQKGSHVS